MDIKKVGKNKKEGGFTLIELLVVVAIIGVLAAIAIPQYQEYVVNASESACESEVAGYKTKVEAYLLDNDRYSEPSTPTNYEGSCTDITITTDAEDSITATYKSPASGSYKIVRDSEGVWSEEEVVTTP